MKTIAAAILINLISYTARADGPVGRFQPVPATVDLAGQSAAIQEKWIFKIDTVTGRTWWFLNAQNKSGTVTEKWIAIEE